MSILMRDSGIEWIGDIPKSWRIDRLKDIVNINFESLSTNTDLEYLLKYIEISNVNNQGIISKDEIRELTFEEAPSRAKRIVKEGDTIVSSVRPNLQALAYIDSKENNLICSTGFFTNRVIWDKRHNKKYVYYYLLSEFSRQSFISYGKGVGYPAVDDKDYSTLKVVYPPKDVQKQIAGFLDKVTLQIDNAIKTKEKQLKTLEALKKSIIHNAVSKGLDDSVEMIDSKIEWIGDIPKSWRIDRLKDIININSESLTTNTDLGYLLKYIEISNVNNQGLISKDEIRELTFEEAPSRAKRIIKNGDTIVSSVRPNLQALAYIDSEENNLICSTGFFTNRIIWNKRHNGKYVYYFLLSEFARQSFISCGKGVGYPAVDDKDYSTLKIVYPTREEQEKIVKYLDTEVEKINTLKENVKNQIDKLKEYKKSLIYEYVTGKKQIKG